MPPLTPWPAPVPVITRSVLSRVIGGEPTGPGTAKAGAADSIASIITTAPMRTFAIVRAPARDRITPPMLEHARDDHDQVTGV